MGMQLRRIGLLEQEAEAGAITTGIIRFAAASDDNTQDITIAGFGTPKAVLFIGTNAKNDGVATNVLVTSVGATDGINHWVSANRSEHDVTSFEPDTDRYWATDKVIAIIRSVGAALAGYATFTSFITDGVRIKWNGGGTVADHTGMLITAVFIGGNGVSADVGVMSTGAVDSAVTVTTGFETKGLITKTHYFNLDGGFDSTLFHPIGVGSWDGTTVRQAVGGILISDNVSPVNPKGIVRDDAVAVILDGSRNFTAYVEWGNITSTTFDITPRVLGNDWNIGYVAIGGVEAWAGVQDSPTSTGLHDFTGPTFQPSFALMDLRMHTALNTQQENANASGFGLSVFNEESGFAHAWAEEAGVTTTNNQSLSDDTAIHLTDHQGTQTFLASFERFLSNGVRLNFSVADATVRKWPTLFLR